MRGLICRGGLTDVAALEGASVREKQAQRKRCRSEKENDNDTDDDQPKPKRRNNQLTDIVKNRNKADAKRLEDARKLDSARHADSIALQECSLALQENMSGLVSN
ncbi:hypothetical protein B0H11DRAFT_1934752 [Mycena galericulata]|nr:hypothetical protein B0H11DRAFT_1934752 [Mycena galericulata]